jgi:surface antigen
MKKLLTGIAIASLSVSLIGCQNMNKQDVGVITGGAIGGLLGSQFGKGNGQVLASVGGAIAGAAIGGLIGKNMDETDKLKLQQALESSKTDHTTRWKNPDNGNSYSVKPIKTYYPKHKRKSQGSPCREYYSTAMIGGKKEQIYGTACRQADGSWKTVKS